MNTPYKKLLISSATIKLLKKTESPRLKDIEKDLEKFNYLLSFDPELAIIFSRKIIIRILQHISCHNETGHNNFSLSELIELCYHKTLINEKVKVSLDSMNQISNLAMSTFNYQLGLTSEDKLHLNEISTYVNLFEFTLKWHLKHLKSYNDPVRTYFNLAPELMKPFHFMQICELEKKYPPQFRTSSDTINKWHYHNPNIYTVITDIKKKNVIGLIEALPLNKEYSDRLYKSELNDIEIPADAILKFDKPAILKLYISSVIIDTYYYNSDIFIFMFDAFLKKLLMLARKGIYFTEVFADIINAQGRKIARYWEMVKVNDTQHASSIFKLTLIPPSLEELLHITDHKTAESLNYYYERKFNELKELLEIIL
ncbi:MAG: hypothetical protein WCH34_02165 [Bacteroidota bacterium]